MKGISICLYGGEISKEKNLEGLHSVLNQKWFETNDNYEVLLANKGETLSHEKIDCKIFKLFGIDENTEKYVAFNTLVKNHVQYDTVVFFDCNSVMNPEYLDEVVPAIKNAEIVSCKYNERKKCYIAAIKKDVFEKFGGFKVLDTFGEKEFSIRTKSFVCTNEQKRERSRRIYSTKQIDEIIREANQGYEVDMFPFYDADIKLRGSGVIFNMTAEELEEYQKCYDNPEYFIDNYGVFRTDDGDRTVELRPYQKKVIDVVTAEHYDVSRVSHKKRLNGNGIRRKRSESRKCR